MRVAALELSLALFLVPAAAGNAFSFEESGRLGPLSYRVLAPAWIWQGEAMSVLVVLELENAGGGSRRSGEAAASEVNVELELSFADEAFETGEKFESNVHLSVVSGAPTRFAFKGLKTRRGVPADPQPFGLRLRLLTDPADIPTVSEKLSFLVKTIRGPLVPRGTWSILVPAILSLLPLSVFLVFLRRFSKPGAWKRVEEREIPVSEDRWWIATT